MWMREMLSDREKCFSSTRTVFVLTVFVVLAVWAYVSIKNTVVSDIPAGVAGMMFTFMAGKVGQTWIERK
jgi:hypothetical protein